MASPKHYIGLLNREEDNEKRRIILAKAQQDNNIPYSTLCSLYRFSAWKNTHEYKAYQLNKPIMKKLVKEAPKPDVTPVTLEQLTDQELVAYACQSSGNMGNYAVLTKISPCEWGFINLGNSNNQPAYKQPTRQQCIKLASSSRQLYMFDTMQEMIRCIYNKVF